MSELKYWNPTQVKLYARTAEGPVWLDDAVGIDIRIEDQKVPHFGFRDRYFRAVSYGRTIVSGNLYVQFRFPNYLSHVLNNVRTESDISSDKVTKERLPSFADYNNVSGDDKKALLTNSILSTRGLESYLQYAKAFKDIYYDGIADTTSTKRFHINENRAGEFINKPLDITIQYGDHTFDSENAFTQIVKHIYFVGTSHTISVLDGNGDQSLLEVYSFFAKNVVAQN